MDNSENTSIFEDFPLLCTLEKSKHYEGVIKIENTPVRFTITAPSYPKLANTKIHLFSGYKFLKTISPDSKKYNDDFLQFVQSFREEIIEQLPTVNVSNAVDNFSETLVKLLKQINHLNQPPDSSDYQINLNHNDREHRIEVTITKFPGYEDRDNYFLTLAIDTGTVVNNHVYVMDTSLPFAMGYFVCDSEQSIEYYLNVFQMALKSLDEFYVDLNTIDTLCHVVDPPVITTKSNTRTIKFNERVFLKIILDPCNPTSITIKIMGPTSDTEYLRNLYNERINEWDDNLDIYKNLLKLFNLMYFPMKPIADETVNMDEDENVICNICFSYRMDGQLPLIRCDNRRCDLIFHSMCLKKWFATLKETTTFLEVTFGSCPFCKEKISTSYIDLYN